MMSSRLPTLQTQVCLCQCLFRFTQLIRRSSCKSNEEHATLIRLLGCLLDLYWHKEAGKQPLFTLWFTVLPPQRVFFLDLLFCAVETGAGSAFCDLILITTTYSSLEAELVLVVIGLQSCSTSVSSFLICRVSINLCHSSGFC